MSDLIFLFMVIAIVWLAFSLSNVVRVLRAFHQDYRRIHKLDTD